MVLHFYLLSFAIFSKCIYVNCQTDLICNVFAVKAPLLAYNSFVEAIFVLNDCNARTGHSSSQSTKNENRLFSIR